MNNSLKMIITLSCLILLANTSVFAESEENSERGNRQGNAEMRQAAQDACAEIAEGEACSVVNARGEEMTGACGTRRSDVMTCLIERPERGEGMGRGMGMGMGGDQDQSS